MMWYAGIALHATNSVLVVIDDADRVLYQKRLRNDLPLMLTALEPYRLVLNGVAVESTYNWYWLVDGLMDAVTPAGSIGQRVDRSVCSCIV